MAADRASADAFEQWFQQRCNEDTNPALLMRVETLLREAFDTGRAQVHHAIIRLSPWSHHHPTCARNITATDCDCGLQAAIQEVDPP
jgi:hypothetical protein